MSSGSPRSASPSSPLLTRQDPPPPPAVLRERDADIPREVWTESQVLDMLEQEVRTAVKTSQNSMSRLILLLSGYVVCRKVNTARKRSLGQGNIIASVCHSVHRGSTWAGTPLGRYTPQQVHHTLQAGTPLGNACWDTVNKWAVCILLECILVFLTPVPDPRSVRKRMVGLRLKGLFSH